MAHLCKRSIRNSGGEQAQLKRIEVKSIQSSTLFSDKPSGILLQDANPTQRLGMVLPYPLPAGYWNPHVRCELRVNLMEGDRKQFAKRLSELNEFEIKLHFIYETMSGGEKSTDLNLRGSFSSFRDQVIDNWKQRGEHELIYIAKRI